MTSLEIAELTGKQHKNVMQAIRKMEPAWTKTCGLKFQLTSRQIEQPNGGSRQVPCYQLTKTETLYIATKFNDEARARLVLRWEQLERQQRSATQPSPCPSPSSSPSSSPCTSAASSPLPPSSLPSPSQIVAMADKIIGEGLRLVNASAADTLTATQVAKTFNMTVRDFNRVLSDMGIQHRQGGHWQLNDQLATRGLTELRTYVSYTLMGKKRVRHYMTWTMRGLHYLNSRLGYPNF